MRTSRRLLTMVAVLAAVAVGCGDDDSTATGGSPADDGGGGDDAPTTELFSESDFAPVCRGTGVAAASEFAAGAGLHPVAVLAGADPDYGFSAAQLPDGWKAQFPELGTVELVACMNRTSATPVELCEGYEDDGVSWSVQTHDSTYEVTLRSATTAEIIDEITLDAPADGCPIFSSFSEGSPDPVLDYETPSAELEVFLKPHVQP